MQNRWPRTYYFDNILHFSCCKCGSDINTTRCVNFFNLWHSVVLIENHLNYDKLLLSKFMPFSKKLLKSMPFDHVHNLLQIFVVFRKMLCTNNINSLTVNSHIQFWSHKVNHLQANIQAHLYEIIVLPNNQPIFTHLFMELLWDLEIAFVLSLNRFYFLFVVEQLRFGFYLFYKSFYLCAQLYVVRSILLLFSLQRFGKNHYLLLVAED